MPFDIGAPQIIVLIVLAIIIFGPEKLPDLARKTARVINYVRGIANGARDQLTEHLGPEFSDLRPAALAQNLLLGGEDLGEVKALVADAKASVLDAKGTLADARETLADARGALAEVGMPAPQAGMPAPQAGRSAVADAGVGAAVAAGAVTVTPDESAPESAATQTDADEDGADFVTPFDPEAT